MRIRPLTEADRPIVEAWIAGEPTHQNNTFEFYTETGCRSVIVEDDDGVVLVTKFTPCLRMDTEFSSNTKRVARAITYGLDEMEKQALSQGFKEIVYESDSPALIAFCERRGYRKSSDHRKVIKTCPKVYIPES